MLTAQEGFSDDHGRTAVWTDISCLRFLALLFIGCLFLRWTFSFIHPQQFPGARQIVFAIGIGNQAIVPDAMKTAGQDKDKKAADKLVSVQRHGCGSLRVLAPIIFPLEGDALLIHREESAIGNGHSMRIA